MPFGIPPVADRAVLQPPDPCHGHAHALEGPALPRNIGNLEHQLERAVGLPFPSLQEAEFVEPDLYAGGFHLYPLFWRVILRDRRLEPLGPQGLRSEEHT